jgi:hypothetical protein
VKKLISIGVALALLTMAVVPGVAAAQCDYDGVAPATYSKIPFAIIQTGLMLFADVWEVLDTPEGLDIGMPWIAGVLDDIAPWAGGPLAWTVDMLAWGVSLAGSLIGGLDLVLGDLLGDLPFALGDLAGIFDIVACGLFQPWACNITGANFTPCAGVEF